MIPSVFYILLVFSVIRTAQNYYLDSIPGLGEWISSSLKSNFMHKNSENDAVEFENKQVPNEEVPKVVDASESNQDIRVVANADEPIPVDELLDHLNSDEVKMNDDQHKKEIVALSQQLATALYNDSIRKVNVLIKGIWHVVDLGLAGSSQRSRSAKKAHGMLAAFLSTIGKLLCGLFYQKKEEEDYVTLDENMLPINFDARRAWPECQDLISLIRDQARPGSCWAVAAASALSDRLCIASKGRHKKPLSSEDLMRCCPKCPKLVEGAVRGGSVYETLVFLKDHGIVSGGEYGSEEGCMPYSYPPYHHRDYRTERQKNAECDKTCSNTNYKRHYEEDKYKIDGSKYYQLPKDTVALKKELKANGSCTAQMLEYDDFRKRYHEKSIYTRKSNTIPGDHVVRLIGWGKENGIDYWLIANSRGTVWGDVGIGKINMVSGCDFGKHVACVKPKIPDEPDTGAAQN